MEFKLKTPAVKKQGHTTFQVKFEMETVDPNFRDNVARMILAALDGATVGQEVEEQAPVMGFHKDDEEEA